MDKDRQRRQTNRNKDEGLGTWGNNGFGVAHIESSHVPDGKSISGVNVGQTDGLLDDSRKCGDIGDLFDGGKKTADAGWITRMTQLLEHQF